MEQIFKLCLKYICFSAALWFSLNIVSAQTSADEKKWHFLTDIYLMFPYMDGETGMGNLITVPVDANPGDIFSKLKFAGMLYFEAHSNKWAITSDLVYMNLNQEVTPGTLLHSGYCSVQNNLYGNLRLFTELHHSLK